jgi:hypothetical protein
MITTSLVLLLASGLTTPAAQADNGEYAIVDSFPFASSFAVASDKEATNEDQRVFLGSGGGIFTLNGAELQPSIDEAGSPADHRLRTEGCVRAIRLLGDKIYVAAKEGGLQRFRRSDHFREFKHLLDKTEPGAWSLDVVDIGGGLTWAIVGSNDDEVNGSLYVVKFDDTENPPTATLLDDLTINFGVPVHVPSRPPRHWCPARSRSSWALRAEAHLPATASTDTTSPPMGRRFHR